MLTGRLDIQRGAMVTGAAAWRATPAASGEAVVRETARPTAGAVRMRLRANMVLMLTTTRCREMRDAGPGIVLASRQRDPSRLCHRPPGIEPGPWPTRGRTFALIASQSEPPLVVALVAACEQRSSDWGLKTSDRTEPEACRQGLDVL